MGVAWVGLKLIRVRSEWIRVDQSGSEWIRVGQSGQTSWKTENINITFVAFLRCSTA